MTDRLAAILARKRDEVRRRLGHLGLFEPARAAPRQPMDVGSLRRTERGPRVIAEVKFRSPSEGEIRARRAGDGRRVAAAYAAAGASAISVLCDGPGFGGGALELRRIARQTSLPVLFKEFVLHPVQLDLALACGASMALLLVRALAPEDLCELVDACRARGLVPVVEAASEAEVAAAVATGAEVIGVNARDLSTFEVDPAAARAAIERVPTDRVAVYMSGVSRPEHLRALQGGRCDAALVGTSLMRADDPGEQLRSLLGGLS